MWLWISAFLAASITSASVAPSLPSRMFSRSDMLNSMFSWNTTAMLRRSDSRVTRRMSTPSMVTLPSSGV
jgi:hypothetical protein